MDCPRCQAQSNPDQSEEFEPGALANFPVGRERGLDPIQPCPVDERPTDEEARAHSCDSAEQWYARSVAGAYLHPANVEAAFRSLPEGKEEDSSLGQAGREWRYTQGLHPAVPLEGDEEPLPEDAGVIEAQVG